MRKRKTKAAPAPETPIMAYEESQIIELAKEAFEKWYAANPQSMLKNKKHEVKLPEYYPGYTIAHADAEHIRDHAVKGRFPKKLFEKKAPNQTPEEAEWMEANYKQVTLPVFPDYISTITRGDNPNNIHIKYEKDESVYEGEKSLQYYLENEIKDYGSLELWRKTVLPSVKTIDANGIICIKPWNIPIVTEDPTEEYPEGRAVIDPDRLLEPIPYYYPCEKIVSCLSDNYYMVELDEKSMVMVGTKEERCGKVYEFIDDENIWRVIQYGKYNEGNFRIELYFNHAEGVTPVTVLMGIPVQHEGRVMWQSPYIYIVDILDMAALNNTWLLAVLANCTYPYTVAIGSECTYHWLDKSKDPLGLYVKCNDGWITNEYGKEVQCPSCKGVGMKDRRSPLGVLLLRSGTARSPGEETFKNKPLEFISPSTTTQEFLRDKVEQDILKAIRILHIHTSNTTVKGSENMTATGMSIDNQAMQAFVKMQSDQVWDIDKFTVDRIGWQRYGNAYKKPVRVPPSTFEFLTPQDYMMQVAEAVKAGAPPFIVRAIMIKFLQTYFYNQKEAMAVFEIIVEADRIISMDSQDIAIGLGAAKPTIMEWEKILHDSGITLIQELLMENPKYLEQDLKVKIEQLKEKAKAKASEIESAQPQSELAGRILSIANNEAA